MKLTPEMYQRALETIKELETRLEEQAQELTLMGTAGLEIRQDDAEQLSDYQTTNKALIEFVEKVAESKSKFGTEARRLLGR
jgi:type II secretory pathway component PulM